MSTSRKFQRNQLKQKLRNNRINKIWKQYNILKGVKSNEK